MTRAPVRAHLLVQLRLEWGVAHALPGRPAKDEIVQHALAVLDQGERPVGRAGDGHACRRLSKHAVHHRLECLGSAWCSTAPHVQHEGDGESDGHFAELVACLGVRRAERRIRRERNIATGTARGERFGERFGGHRSAALAQVEGADGAVRPRPSDPGVHRCV